MFLHTSSYMQGHTHMRAPVRLAAGVPGLYPAFDVRLPFAEVGL